MQGTAATAPSPVARPGAVLSPQVRQITLHPDRLSVVSDMYSALSQLYLPFLHYWQQACLQLLVQVVCMLGD
jgi:hypothetical protein